MTVFCPFPPPLFFLQQETFSLAPDAPHTHTDVLNQLAAGDRAHSKQNNFIEQFLHSDYPSSITSAALCVYVCL